MENKLHPELIRLTETYKHLMSKRKVEQRFKHLKEYWKNVEMSDKELMVIARAKEIESAIIKQYQAEDDCKWDAAVKKARNQHPCSKAFVQLAMLEADNFRKIAVEKARAAQIEFMQEYDRIRIANPSLPVPAVFRQLNERFPELRRKNARAQDTLRRFHEYAI